MAKWKYVSMKLRFQNDLTCTKLKGHDAKYHKSCYKKTCSSLHLDRSRKRYSDALNNHDISQLQPKKGRPSQSNVTSQEEASNVTPVRTRSSVPQFSDELCFFCQTIDPKKDVHEVQTGNAGGKLDNATGTVENEIFKRRLAAAVDPKDATAIKRKVPQRVLVLFMWHNVLRRKGKGVSNFFH